MRYCIVLEDGQIIDINDHDIFCLTDDEIDEMREDVPNDYIYDAAQMYHQARMDAMFKKFENG